MSQWRVHVQGQQFDLKLLQESLADHDPSIIQDGSNFYLTSKEWTQSDEAGAIHSRAKEFIEWLENAAYLHFREKAPLTIGGVVRIDEKGLKHYVIVPESLSLNITSQPVRLQTTVQPAEVRQEHPMARLLSAAEKHPNVRDALKFYRKGDWVSLYKVYELVRDDVGGEQQLFLEKWVAKNSLKRFTQMAQSREGLGDEARHASQKFKPPKPAVSPEEAKNTVGSLLQKWINSL